MTLYGISLDTSTSISSGSLNIYDSESFEDFLFFLLFWGCSSAYDFSIFPWGGSSPSPPPGNPSLISPTILAFLKDIFLLEELGWEGWLGWQATFEGESTWGLYLILDSSSFVFIILVLTMVFGLLFSWISWGSKISVILVYPTNFKWATNIQLGSNPWTTSPSMNLQVSNSLATSFKCIKLLTQLFSTKNGVCTNYFLCLCSKKDDLKKS